MLSFQEIEVASEGQAEGRLVLSDGKLVGVVTCLEKLHDELNGQWYVDIAFNGLESLQSRTFPSLDDVRHAFTEVIEEVHPTSDRA